jgi:hypothetical protein
MIERGMIDDAMAQQWPILHQAKHGVSPFYAHDLVRNRSPLFGIMRVVRVI